MDIIDDLLFEPIGTTLAIKLSSTFTGLSPYTGSLSFDFELVVHCDVFDDNFVVTVWKGGAAAARISSPFGFSRDAALCEAIGAALGTAPRDTLAQTTRKLADYGYRVLSFETGAIRGHTETITVMADRISELDAALKLDIHPECIYDLLDAGSDPMRHHIKYGRPFEAARIKARMRADYEDVVAYMRACGAH
ncbi:hypothetical protein [Janthinobacterium sp. CAN_S7]|uniref:hypothetical protein n=1 Tax=Janthinobacterium sp. CAN_S7 TaxID=3071704 RepID=UPI00319E0670